MREIYLDSSASAPAAPEAVEAMMQCMRETYGNPSSLHRKGVAAARALENARAAAARPLGADPSELYFTSGATESVNLALRGAAHALRRNGNRILTSPAEHESTLAVCKQLERDGFKVDMLKIDPFGRVRPETFADAVRNDTVLAALAHVNSELGTVNRIQQLAAVLKRKNQRALFFADGAQALGKMPIDLRGVDLYAVSSHKIGGPKGIGALFVRNGVRIQPLLFGGGQERGLRPGTENAPAAAGFAAAVNAAYEEMPARRERLRRLRRRFIDALSQMERTRINSPEDGVETIVNAAFLGVPAETLSHALEERGVFVSTGSACSSKNRGVSSVLAALPISEEARLSSLRFSFPPNLSERDIDEAAAAVRESTVKLRQLLQFGR